MSEVNKQTNNSEVNKQTNNYNNCSPAALFVSEWCTNHGIIKQQKTTSASSFTETDVGEDTETYALRKRKKKKKRKKIKTLHIFGAVVAAGQNKCI